MASACFLAQVVELTTDQRLWLTTELRHVVKQLATSRPLLFKPYPPKEMEDFPKLLLTAPRCSKVICIFSPRSSELQEKIECEDTWDYQGWCNSASIQEVVLAQLQRSAATANSSL